MLLASQIENMKVEVGVHHPSHLRKQLGKMLEYDDEMGYIK
jgi:hypothetical protein